MDGRQGVDDEIQEEDTDDAEPEPVAERGSDEGMGEAEERPTRAPPARVLDIQAGEMANPFGGVQDMAARLGAGDKEPAQGLATEEPHASPVRSSKRRRRSSALPALPRPESPASPPPRGDGLAGLDADPLAPLPDPITARLLTLSEAEALMDIFYSGSADFINAYDRARDTLPALRARSGFSLSAVLMVGARVRDGPRPSALQRALVAHTQRMAMRTLVAPPGASGGGVEDVKALILLAAFSENGWLVAGHAVRLAVELGLDRAFGELVRRGMGRAEETWERRESRGGGRGEDEGEARDGAEREEGHTQSSRAPLESDRPLVEATRVWYAVYRLEHQMSYGMGRPAIVREDTTIHNARLLLDHPLALDSDMRLVYAVELLALRAPLHVDLTAGADADEPLGAETLARLRWANEQFDAWERYWAGVLDARYGEEGTGFVRESCEYT